MLTLQRQPYNGCFATAIAVLLNRPCQEIVAELSQVAGIPDYTANLRSLTNLQAYGLLKAYLPGSTVTTVPVFGYVPGQGPKPRLTVGKLKGQGVLTVWYTHHSGHAVAFDNGIIYDGNAAAPMPYREWAAVQRRHANIQYWRIDYADRKD